VTHPSPDLTALVDGALPPERAEELRRHLRSCPACAAEERRLGEAVALLRALPAAPEPSPLFGARLEARLREEGERRRGWLPSFMARALRWKVAIPGVALAATVAVVAVVSIRVERGRERAIAQQLELLEDYEAIVSLGDVGSAEDVLVITHLDELEGEGRP
jgi:anti-sigma factor RsiW